MEKEQWTGVKVFSTTKHQERLVMGEQVTAWRRENPKLHIVDTVVSLSSDSEFHCLAITVFYR